MVEDCAADARNVMLIDSAGKKVYVYNIWNRKKNYQCLN